MYLKTLVYSLLQNTYLGYSFLTVSRVFDKKIKKLNDD
jgi:hypothetical protein